MENFVFSGNEPAKFVQLKILLICFLFISTSSVIGGNILFLSKINNISYENYGIIFELIVLLLLILIFFIIQTSPLHPKNYLIISIGMILWIVSGTIDFMDELFQQPLWLSVWGEDLLRSVGMVLCIIGLGRLVKSVKRYIRDIKKLAIYDELTELPNRRCFNSVLSNYENRILTIIILDLDYFKRINDTYGHEKGDTVLQEFGRILADKNLPNAMSARLGGEEFAIFIDTQDLSTVENYISSLLESCRSIKIHKDTHLTVSAGIALKQQQESTHNAMKRADQALYRAKINGRNRYEWSIDK
ncbi:GGDEF domain-containing protein [Vibrio diazotrophicus]|uniref:GGDEF domain-containing protein n=1 Tax=Vibrio diazotrophicus TaxID=685 RepID=UPI00142D8F14|nr:GGDEF domain-containing protein [Vibrio diazotrophicus]NIY90730.1 GGDEF domain-containing protein [Vibrio diazotrophicus]